VRVDRRAGDKLYVAVRYAECEDRPVRVMSGGCGCDASECEYTRVRDSYAVRVLPKLPASYPDRMQAPDARAVWECVACGRPCPPCPTEPWVILADVALGTDGSIALVDCFAHRRFVASLADFYFMCRPLRVGTVRIVDATDVNEIRMKAPKDALSGPSDLNLRVIEVTFENALADPDSVTDASFKVENVTTTTVTPVPGRAVLAPAGDSVRWTARTILKIGRYRATLSGTSPDAITSEKGAPLDGEPTQLPSGDGCPGGDFTFEFEVVRPPIQ
jgi:hypothetical protein